MFCHFLLVCSFITLARAEDNNQERVRRPLPIRHCTNHKFQLKCYIEAYQRGKEFRKIAAEHLEPEKLSETRRADLIAKHFQVVRLEIEAVMQLQEWQEMDSLFEECWKYEDPDRYETLADLAIVVLDQATKANADEQYQQSMKKRVNSLACRRIMTIAGILATIQKIVDHVWRLSACNIDKLSRWLRCLFRLSLTVDENTSLYCLDQAALVAANRRDVSNEFRISRSVVADFVTDGKPVSAH
jgi:hypothetical protein